MQPLAYIRAYSRGYIDSQQNRPYRDRNIKHYLTVVVPGCKFYDIERLAYRDGWIDGKIVQST